MSFKSPFDRATDLGWPAELPLDLASRLDTPLSLRNTEPVEIWAAVREWLAELEVEAPSGVRVATPWADRDRPV